MTSPKWALVERDFQYAARHFQMAEIIHTAEAGYVQASAFMFAVQSGHTSLEAGCLRIFNILGEPAPHDLEKWHEAVVDQAFADVGGRGPIFTPDLFADVDETRRARNLAISGFNAFDMGTSEATAQAAGRLFKALPDAFRQFIQRIEGSQGR